MRSAVTHDEDVERRAEGSRHFITDRNAAAREREDDDVLTAVNALTDRRTEEPACLKTIAKRLLPHGVFPTH